VFDRKLERRQPQLLQPADLGSCERLVGQVVERRPAPQFERLARRTFRDQLLEPRRIDRIRFDPQLVPAATGHDRGSVTSGSEGVA
jgi:hypothetical protein